jgi:hypothetical protein
MFSLENALTFSSAATRLLDEMCVLKRRRYLILLFAALSWSWSSSCCAHAQACLVAGSFPRISSVKCGNITRKQFRLSDTCAVCGGSAGDMTRAGISASEGGLYVETLSGMKPGALSDLWGVGVGKEGGGYASIHMSTISKRLLDHSAYLENVIHKLRVGDLRLIDHRRPEAGKIFFRHGLRLYSSGTEG